MENIGLIVHDVNVNLQLKVLGMILVRGLNVMVI